MDQGDRQYWNMDIEPKLNSPEIREMGLSRNRRVTSHNREMINRPTIRNPHQVCSHTNGKCLIINILRPESGARTPRKIKIKSFTCKVMRIVKILLSTRGR